MIRKPEKVEILALVYTLLVFLTGMVYIRNGGGAYLISLLEVTLVGVVLVLTAILGETFFSHIEIRIISLFLHFIGVILILNTLNNYFPLMETTILITLYLPVFLALGYKIGGFVNLIVFLAANSLGYNNGSSFDERMIIGLSSLLFLSLSGIVLYYREFIVNQQETIKSQNNSLENLSSANHSFLEHMENMEEDSAEKERFRITRELHDSIGYTMMNISMMMNAASYCSEEERRKMLEYCAKTKELADSTLDETRTILYRLRDIKKNEQKNVIFFFSKLCNDFSHATGVKTEYNYGNLPESLPEYISAIVKRGVQVGFINALRHGQTEHIKLSFWVYEASLRIYIWNNQPLNTKKTNDEKEGIGLTGLRERVEDHMGTISYGKVSDGFLLTIEIPFKDSEIEKNQSTFSR